MQIQRAQPIEKFSRIVDPRFRCVFVAIGFIELFLQGGAIKEITISVLRILTGASKNEMLAKRGSESRD